MDIFIEKTFIENFEIEYNPEKCSRVQAIIYTIFSEYTGIKLYLDIPENEIEEFVSTSELLQNLFNYNPTYNCINSFYDHIINNDPKYQTLVFTEEKKDWFAELNRQDILCFCWEDYESSINKFIQNTHFKIDLSDCVYPFDWKQLNFVGINSSFLIFSDSYILTDKSGQKIKDNIAKLLQENLDKSKKYKVFIVTDLNESETTIQSKLSRINSSLANYNTKVYLFNRIKDLEKFIIHDRLLYSNFTITDIGVGFNIYNKPSNSIITNESIFEKFTYKRLKKHLEEIQKYIMKLETWEDYNKPYKTNSKNAYKEFQNALL